MDDQPAMEDKLEKVSRPIDRMLDRLTPGAVFGEPTTENGVTIIPVAEVTAGFGFGTGRAAARRADEKSEAETEVADRGTGSGGGAGGRAAPRGYIRITPDGVKYRPITDDTRIAMAGIALAAWAVFWIGKTIRAFAGK